MKWCDFEKHSSKGQEGIGAVMKSEEYNQHADPLSSFCWNDAFSIVLRLPQDSWVHAYVILLHDIFLNKGINWTKQRS